MAPMVFVLSLAGTRHLPRAWFRALPGRRCHRCIRADAWTDGWRTGRRVASLAVLSMPAAEVRGCRDAFPTEKPRRGARRRGSEKPLAGTRGPGRWLLVPSRIYR